MMLFALLSYLTVSVPLLAMLISWRLTDDPKAAWKLPPPRRGRFFWLMTGFALAVFFLASGLGCSVFNIGSYVYDKLDRVWGGNRGDDYSILFLFALAVSVPMGLIGYFGSRACWRRFKSLLLKEKETELFCDKK